MSSRKLSSEEVEALMDGLKGSSHNVHADVSGTAEVRSFQFGEDDLSLMGDYYALRLINERFARVARGVFLPMLRVQPRISPFPPEVKTFDEYCESIGTFMNLNISRMEELRGPPWRKELTFLDVNNFVCSTCCLNKISLATKECRYLVYINCIFKLSFNASNLYSIMYIC